MEEWREIKGFEGKYIVSNEGVVKNVKRGSIVKGVKQRIRSNYIRTMLFLTAEHSNVVFIPLCKVVALAFPEICGEYFEGAEVDHVDGNPQNNAAENLRFCTHTENMRNPNTKNKKARAVLQYDMDGNLVREWPSTRELRRSGYSGVSLYLRGINKTAYGYHWEYKN